MTQMTPDITIATDAITQQHRRRMAPLPPRLVKQGTAIAHSDGVPPRRRHVATYAISFSSSSPGNSLTDGYFMISLRAIFQAFWTIQDSDRSCRVASSWISLSMSSGKYRDCLRLSEPAIRDLVSRTAYTVSRHRPVYGRTIWQMAKQLGSLDRRDPSSSVFLDASFTAQGVVIPPARHYPIALFNPSASAV